MASGGHTTRTLVFDTQGRLYVSIGSAGNVDSDSSRSRIRRFQVSSIPDGGVSFSSGELFADGLRNEVGLAFDKHSVLWGVENGADNLQRSDLGGDITNDNPGEELNRFPESLAGSHWGYPWCWSEFILGSFGQGTGTIWAWPSTMNDGTHTDSWCRENTLASVMSMQAHSAPLGITFYDASKVESGCSGSFPSSWDGHAIIPFHGSWNRDIPTGYKVVRVPMGIDGMPTVSQPIDLLCHDGTSARWPAGNRPVDARFDRCGRLLVTDDGASSVLVMTSYGNFSGNSPTTSSPGSEQQTSATGVSNHSSKRTLSVRGAHNLCLPSASSTQQQLPQLSLLNDLPQGFWVFCLAAVVLVSLVICVVVTDLHPSTALNSPLPWVDRISTSISNLALATDSDMTSPLFQTHSPIVSSTDLGEFAPIRNIPVHNQGCLKRSVS